MYSRPAASCQRGVPALLQLGLDEAVPRGLGGGDKGGGDKVPRGSLAAAAAGPVACWIVDNATQLTLQLMGAIKVGD